MSANDALLIFVDRHNEFEGWLRLADGHVGSRGTALEGLPALVDPESGEPLPLVAVVPGDAVSVHALELPAGLAPAQAAAAARLMAADVSTQPIEDMHVAVGPEQEGSPLRTVALTPALSMAGWLGRLQAAGLDPDLVVPEPLLLAPPDEGYRCYNHRDVPLYRSRVEAFSIEPDLARMIVADQPVETIDTKAFEAELGEAVKEPPVNLRQGPFAKRRQWAIDWARVRRMALLGLAILGVTLAIQLAAILRYSSAADALEVEASRVAARALPVEARTGDTEAELERRLTAMRGGGIGYSAIATALFSAVRATPNAELTALSYDPDGRLHATVQGDSPATLATLQQRIEASGFIVTAGAMGTGGGRPTAELTVYAR